MRILEILFFCFYGFSAGSAWVFQVDGIHDAPSTPNHRKDKSDEIRVVYEDVRSPCHSEGRASQCMPPFTNIAEGAPVVATSTCGASDKTEKFCKQQVDATGRIQWRCEQCTSEDKFPTHHLTDRHQMVNETYWVSGAVLRGQTINITLSMGKTFEVYYVSLQPYGRLPDAIALYKSSDFGKTWHPWQYFSTDCFRAFRLPTSNEHNAQISAANIQEVLCVALKSSEDNEPYGRSLKVIAFSTTIGRPSSQPWSAALVDWMTMTDLRVSLTRFSDLADMTQHDASGLLLTPNLLSPAEVFRVGEVEKNKMSAGTLGMSRHHFQSDAASFMPDKGIHFAFSDLAIGGRCKCNGHSNRCVRDRLVDAAGKETGEWGPLRCDCQHNTAGIDCEKCAPGYLDRPWARATRELANECKPCRCGNHTSECVFSVKHFKQSGGQTGGICVACRHNTEGIHCDQCSAGFTRNPAVPMGHEQACRECRCHPIGSVANEPCDRKSGQCPCKPGVIGQACNRCEEGYKQTRLSDHPCVRVMEHFAYRRKTVPPPVAASSHHQPINTEPHLKCPPCKPHRRRIRFKKFCRREAVFMGKVESYRAEGDKTRFEIRIRETWRVDGAAGRLLPKKASHSLPPFPVWIQSQLIGGDNGNPAIRCLCPELKTGESYLFFTQPYQIPHGNRMELMLDPSSIIIPWRESWRRRLNKFVRRAAKNRCNLNVNRDNTGDSMHSKRAQKLQSSDGYLVNQLANDSPLRFAQTAGRLYKQQYANRGPQGSDPHTVYQMDSDRGLSRTSATGKIQTQFTYYHPYARYPHKTI
ncbi:hypothetical protein CRM22_002075 [Opisthorchis felineus]|uniref:Netrin-1 n=1 Tax=Opisthorchis felineus TaxID=147828 RepID=A0A4S2M7W2_OPIFE|nr:hypothetical protein CRM22_002075 [Opisthorchis felineus]